MKLRRSFSAVVAAVALAATGCSSTGDGEESPPGTLVAGKGNASPEGEADPAAPSPGELDDSVVFIRTTVSGYVLYPSAGTGEFQWSDEVVAQSACTGWVAGPGGEIVTAGHCVDQGSLRSALIKQFLGENNATELAAAAELDWKVEGRENGSPLEVEVVVRQPDLDGATISDWSPVQVVDVQPFRDGDLALLRANGLRSDGVPPAMEVARVAPETGAEVTAIGFPGSVRRVSNEMIIPNPSFKSGTVSSKQVSPRGVAGYEINADISQGMSGGPTVNAAGEVVGVNSYLVVGESQAFNFITDTADLNRFLARNSVG